LFRRGQEHIRKAKRQQSAKANRNTHPKETGGQTVAEKQDHMDRGKTATPSQQRPLVDKTTAQRERSLTSQGSTTMSLWCDSTDFFQAVEFDEK
jgi:hypothetical protein